MQVFKYKPMQKGDSLFLVSQETTIQHFLFLCHHTGLASCLARGVLRWWQKEEGAEEGYSSSLLPSPAPTLTTPSLSPRKMSVFLLMLQQRCPSCSFRAKSRATRPGSSVLCIDHYAQSEWLYPGRVRPQVRLVGKYHTFSLPGDRITFGKCRKKE